MQVQHRRVLPTALLIAIALVLGVLPAMAYASPPDPSWVAGIYDGADYDDVVVLVTLATASVSLAPLADLTPDLRAIEKVPPSVALAIPATLTSVVLPRGPPTV
jgi:hypothetical protein